MAQLSETQWNDLYHAVGFVTVHWSSVESLLDICVAVIYQKHDSKKYAPKREIPRSLKPKLKFVRQSLQNVDTLLPFKQDGITIIGRISDIAKKRHDMIHGRISEMSINSYHFDKIDYLTTIHSHRELKFTLEDFAQAGKTMLDLATDMIPYLQRLVQPLLP